MRNDRKRSVSGLAQAAAAVAVHRWHSILLGSGGVSGGRLAPRTVGHAHRLLHSALERAVKLELVTRNVAHAIHPPGLDGDEEAVILIEEQIAHVLGRNEHPLYAIAALA